MVNAVEVSGIEVQWWYWVILGVLVMLLVALIAVAAAESYFAVDPRVRLAVEDAYRDGKVVARRGRRYRVLSGGQTVELTTRVVDRRSRGGDLEVVLGRETIRYTQLDDTTVENTRTRQRHELRRPVEGGSGSADSGGVYAGYDGGGDSGGGGGGD